jgi:hypothetical protein
MIMMIICASEIMTTTHRVIALKDFCSYLASRRAGKSHITIPINDVKVSLQEDIDRREYEEKTTADAAFARLCAPAASIATEIPFDAVDMKGILHHLG